LVVIRGRTLWMKETGNRGDENTGEQEDGGQPQRIPLNTPGDA
jgi:hypothetical protein